MGVLALPAAAQGHQFKRCAPDGGPAPFTEYYLGESFEGDALDDRGYECRRPSIQAGEPPVRTHDVTYFYEGDEIQVQTSPACDRWWGMYNVGRPDHDDPIRRPKLIRVRGVPATRGQRSLELYTGDVAVAIFSGDRAKIDRAAQALRAVGSTEAGGDLPPPLPGALRGQMDCGFKFSYLDAKQGGVLAFNIARPAYFDVELERRVDGKWVWTDQQIFDAAKGTTFRELGVRPGRYRGTVAAWDHVGRRTHVRPIAFRVRSED